MTLHDLSPRWAARERPFKAWGWGGCRSGAPGLRLTTLSRAPPSRPPRSKSSTPPRAAGAGLAKGLMDRTAQFPHLAGGAPEEDAPHDFQDDRRMPRRAYP